MEFTSSRRKQGRNISYISKKRICTTVNSHVELMVAYLTDARMPTVTRREGYMSWGGGGVEYLLNPCTGLNTRLHPGMDPGVGSILEYECSVTQ